MRPLTVKDFQKALSGDEPTWQEPFGSITAALNWYNYYSDSKESKKFAIEYLKSLKSPKTDIETVSKVPENEFSNLGFLCRMKLRGAPFTDKNLEYIDNQLNLLKQERIEVVVESVEPVAKVINIQERVQEKVKEFLGEIEGQLDDCYLSKNYKLFDPYAWFQKNQIKGMHAKYISNFFQKRIAEITEVLEGKDKQLVEAYSNFGKVQLKQYLDLLNKIVSDCVKISQVSKAIRAPKKTKSKPIEKIISKLTYKKEDNEYKIASINPRDIIGASQLWVFNTKTRKLGCLLSKDSDGLNIKSTSIINIDEDSSLQKTLRKPEPVLQSLLKSPKGALKKFLSTVNSVEQRLTGRINCDTILVRVVK
jgi:hypothetical protein